MKNNIRDTVLEEARLIINGPRQELYGPAEVNFKRCADRWSQQLEGRGKMLPFDTLDAKDVALMMVELKLARLATRYSRDSVIDAIGYLAIYAELMEGNHAEETEGILDEAGANAYGGSTPGRAFTSSPDYIVDPTLGDD